MTPPITQEERERVQKLAEAATKGPWTLFHQGKTVSVYKGKIAARCNGGKEVVSWVGFDSSDFTKNRAANAAFIAASRTAIPAYEALVVAQKAEIARLTGELTDARAECERLVFQCGHCVELRKEQARADNAEARVAALEEAIAWACGYDMPNAFRLPRDGEGRWYWRKELRERSGMGSAAFDAAEKRARGADARALLRPAKEG